MALQQRYATTKSEKITANCTVQSYLIRRLYRTNKKIKNF